ncbi:phosphate acyltransferase PlsX [Stratiformator vulcanicus]|uniref:Phosphate acyltransferase n=1 Tax=Stratiformator vulcanicus TaxID=2527980 RepID=A0A517R4Q5_9PLAN|nr:phosphate acyltransferase PlsX [Stratiformator vulcanicus]QDT38867.1 Phosphate acyltransferase [Stratiformator vulcanicus]
MRIALDAMGGDHAPEPNVHGAIAALDLLPEISVCLVGDRPRLETLLSEAAYSGDRITVHAAEGFIEMHEKPVEALRKKPKCSLAVCWQMMAGKEVDAVVSAGNTGAVVAAGLRTRLFLKGVKRPGIAVTLPTLKGKSVLIDVGANPQARSEHLYQYAVMGSIYAKSIFKIDSPRIGLINIGSEDGKGNELYRETHQLLTSSDLKDQYVGNVEGRGLYAGEADVLICEGFVGNVVLKTSEGIADFLMKSISEAIMPALDADRDKVMEAFKGLGKRFQYHGTGGAPLLGIDGICIICHGSSSADAITNALRAATNYEHQHVNERITAALVRD